MHHVLPSCPLQLLQLQRLLLLMRTRLSCVRHLAWVLDNRLESGIPAAVPQLWRSQNRC